MTEIDDVIKNLLTGAPYARYLKTLGYRELTVHNLFQKFLKNYKLEYLDSEEISYAIEETVRGYSSDKSTAIQIFQQFVAYLSQHLKMEVPVTFPPIDVSNSFERQMYIAKELQNNEKTVQDLSHELWVSPRTIEEDLSRLRGLSGDPIQICGKPFIINETSRRDGLVEMASTVHPFFLTFNLTQVVTLLKGLKKTAQDPGFHQYAMVSARAIWQQLSPYAKKRILYVTEHLIPDDLEWYKSLEENNPHMFYTELECSHTQGVRGVLYCLKNEKPCFIEWRTPDGGIAFLSNCKIVNFTGETITILYENKPMTLATESILRSGSSYQDLL